MTDEIKPKDKTVDTKKQTDDRMPRIRNTRNYEMRDAEIRETLRMSFADPLHVPSALIPEDVDYHWGRDTFKNNPDPGRIASLMQRGWDFVPADRHPGLVMMREDERTKHLEGYIHVKGSVLMERPKRWGVIEKEMEEEASYKSMLGLPVNEVLESGETRALGVRSKTYNNSTGVETRSRSFKQIYMARASV